MTIRVTNIVYTCNFNTSVYLPKFIIHYPFCEWNRKKFAKGKVGAMDRFITRKRDSTEVKQVDKPAKKKTKQTVLRF